MCWKNVRKFCQKEKGTNLFEVKKYFPIVSLDLPALTSSYSFMLNENAVYNLLTKPEEDRG